MRFSIITPSFRNSRWLKLCIASVADQDVQLEHIVQDSCSDDGTQDWLPKDSRVKAFIEKDQGMYDAVNRGLRRASGDILAYLNCDEQYLPGALRAVQEFFEKNPSVEVAFGDSIVVNPQGEYICHRQSCIPYLYHTWVANLCVLTCGIFFRRSVLQNHELYFDTRLKDIGDSDWVLRVIKKKLPMGLLKRFTSVFTETGVNMNLLPNARREIREKFESAPLWARSAYPLILLHHRLRRLVAGHYRSLPPFTYSLYTEQGSSARLTKQATHPTFQWKRI